MGCGCGDVFSPDSLPHPDNLRECPAKLPLLANSKLCTWLLKSMVLVNVKTAMSLG